MNQEDLEREVFGGSDSELSDAEEDVQQQPRQKLTPPPADDDESSGDSEDEYVQNKDGAEKAKPARRPRRGGERGERRPAARKRKRKQLDEEALSEMTPEQASRYKLEAKIDAILKPKNAARTKRKKKDDEDVLDRFADEEVSRLREAMLAAAADDEQSNRDKMPATAKLKLLPLVMATLRKTALAQSIIDNNLLEGVRKWLEPLPDRSLPALDIQKEFFPVLKKMEFIDTNVLKESRLGRIVLFYTKCKRASPDIVRLASDLVSSWSRPIIKRSASYRDRAIPTAHIADDALTRGERLNSIIARAKEGEKGRVRKNAVMIPQRELGAYTVAPNANAGLMRSDISVDIDIERRRRTAERFKSLTRRMAQAAKN